MRQKGATCCQCFCPGLTILTILFVFYMANPTQQTAIPLSIEGNYNLDYKEEQRCAIPFYNI